VQSSIRLSPQNTSPPFASQPLPTVATSMAHPQPANMDLDPAGSGQQTQAQQQSAQAAASGSAPPARKDLQSHPISNLVPLPQFASGQDPAQYLGLLTSWAEMGLMDLTVPGMLQNMLVQGCAADKKSLEFALHFKQERPSASLADTQAAFVDRFGKEVRSKAAKARDLLFDRQIRMVGNMTVQDYTTNFRLQISDRSCMCQRCTRMIAFAGLMLD